MFAAALVIAAPNQLAPQVRAANPEAPHVLEGGWRLIDEVRALYVEQVRAAGRAHRDGAAASVTRQDIDAPRAGTDVRTPATIAAATPPPPVRTPASPPSPAAAPPAPLPPAMAPEPPSTEVAARAAAAVREARQMRLTPSGTAPPPDERPAPPPRCIEDVAALAKQTLIWFEANSIALNPVQVRQLQKLALAAGSCPAGRIEAIGHADQIGSEAVNVAISRRRAEATLDSLKAFGLDPTRVSAVGLGARQPIAQPGNTPFPDPNAVNRRVEFVVR